LIHFMRLSLMKGAHADLSSAAWQEIGVKPVFGLSGIHSTRRAFFAIWSDLLFLFRFCGRTNGTEAFVPEPGRTAGPSAALGMTRGRVVTCMRGRQIGWIERNSRSSATRLRLPPHKNLNSLCAVSPRIFARWASGAKSNIRSNNFTSRANAVIFVPSPPQIIRSAPNAS
jgi:hypothetical protein